MVQVPHSGTGIAPRSPEGAGSIEMLQKGFPSSASQSDGRSRPVPRGTSRTQLAFSLSAYVRKAVDALREGGAGHLMIQMLRKLASPVLEFGSLTFFLRDLGSDLPTATASLDLELGAASIGDLPRIEAFRVAPSGSALGERFQRGDLCFVAIDPRRDIAHSRWVTTQREHLPEVAMDIVLRPGEAYFYDGYTRSDLRGLGIDGVMRCFIFRTLRNRGFRRVYSYVRGDSPGALRAARRWQQPAGRLWYVRFRGGRALVLAGRQSGLPALRRPITESGEQDSAFRACVWREWFESWLGEPSAKRSTGFNALPDEYFASTAAFISGALRLDPRSDCVLDVGCDSAMISRLVAPHCSRFVGVDFIHGMLVECSRESVKSASGRPASFVAADGRALPFPSRAFTKAYCAGVIHTLPSHEDGLRIIEESVRVCRPGGVVLVAGVPDAAKRFRRYVDAWRASGVAGKLELAISLAIPRRVKSLSRRLLGLSRRHRLIFLDYDLEELKRMLESRALECRVLHFPDSYWSRDFRRTRSNLLISIPCEGNPPPEPPLFGYRGRLNSAGGLKRQQGFPGAIFPRFSPFA